MKAPYEHPETKAVVVDIACDKDPKHAGTALAGMWDDEKDHPCHTHQPPAEATPVEYRDGDEVRKGWKSPDGSVLMACDEDDECSGRLRRV